MKNLHIYSAIFLICLCGLSVSAQEKTLNDITSFKIRNSGSLLDSKNNVDGYYFFYEVDKLKKGMKEYAIKILDNNLNELATKSYIDKKNTLLAESNFNNQALMFVMVNTKDREYKLISFDRQGNQINEIKIPVEKKELTWLSLMIKRGSFNLLYPIDDKGFIFNYVKDNKKIGYNIKYVATDGGQSWDFSSPKESKEILSINPLQASEDYIILVETSKKSLLSKKVDLKLIVLDTNTGEELFTQPFNREEDPRIITNAFVTDDKQIIILGEYYEAKDNIANDKSEGLFLKALDRMGKELYENKIDWANVDKFVPLEEGKDSHRGYIYFHDIIKTQKGTYLAIGEKYRKTVSLKGMLLNGSLGSGMSQLTITDALFAEFDENFELKEIKVIKKGKSRVQNLVDFGSPQFNAHMIKATGGFDYLFTQIDVNRDRFYSLFFDYERIKGEKNKYAFKSIIYDNDQLYEDKIYLDNSTNKIITRAFPAKLGNVMLMEYNRKEKSLVVHLEPLNMN